MIAERPWAAVFDLDGTLVNSEPRSQAAWRRVFASHGVPADEALIKSFAGRRGTDVLAELAHAFPGQELRSLIAEAQEIVATATDPAIPPVTPVPGAAALVRRIHRRGCPLGLVTSARRRYAERTLAVGGLLGLFAAVVTAEDVAVGKPDPEGFRRASAMLAVPPARCVAFEDSPAGVAAATAAGMTCVGVATTHAPAELAAAHRVVADLTAVGWPVRIP